MYAENLKNVLSCLGASAADLAKYLKCDRSNVSRITSGKRVPKRGGKASAGIIDSLYEIADDKGKTRELSEFLSVGGEISAKEIKNRLADHLYGRHGEETYAQKDAKNVVPYRSFGQKLNAVMTLAELSNIRFGKMLNLDSSYISRFRNGFRSPRSNESVMEAICSILLRRVTDQAKLPQLSAMTGIPVGILESEDESAAAFGKWLYDDQSDDSPVIESLVDRIDSISDEAKTPLLTPEEAAKSETGRTDGVYFGTDGLRSAVIRFLYGVIKKKAPLICLYSDQNMDWMTGSAEFQLKWASLMMACAKGGTKIQIIHNIDREPAEMIKAIEKWLPLYMTGAVRSYYSVKQKNVRFSSTLFLCPGSACISGFNAADCEDTCGIYRYDEDPAILAAQKMTFNEMIKNSKKLVTVYKTEDIGNTPLTEDTDITVIGNMLTLASMPESTLDSILARVGCGEETAKSARKTWDFLCSLKKRCLDSGSFHECIPLADEELLFDGKTYADIPGVLAVYTPVEYAEHVRSVMELSDNNPNYRFYVLPEPMFPSTQMLISKSAVAVSRLRHPHITMLFTHPAMCGAFIAYANRIKEQYKQDKLTARKLLEKYL